MSMVHERIRIGVEENGTVKMIDQLTLDNLDYTLVSEGGEEFAAEQGTEVFKKLKEAEPDKNFTILPA